MHYPSGMPSVIFMFHSTELCHHRCQGRADYVFCQATSATKFSSLKLLEADGIRDSVHPGWRRWDDVGLPRRSRGSLLLGILPLGRVFMRFLRLHVYCSK